MKPTIKGVEAMTSDEAADSWRRLDKQARTGRIHYERLRRIRNYPTISICECLSEAFSCGLCLLEVAEIVGREKFPQWLPKHIRAITPDLALQFMRAAKHPEDYDPATEAGKANADALISL